jgi:2,4-dienoyl-CoA reductase-like NADH-dependent reductase (Old Yellow Enzyme family)/pyruvate/2-oxoglutarate dehydrogenase complex dihydrolipoamide dehydrogenase (E3) component
MPKVSDPIKIGPMLVPNRFHKRPMWDGTADPMGYVIPRAIEQYRRIAAGGYGLNTVEVAAIHPTSYVAPNHIAALDDSYVPGLWELARAIKMEGGKAGIQLFYAGSLSNPKYQIHIPPDKRWVPAPSDAPPDWSYHGISTRALSTDEVEEGIRCYAEGARRMREAEFDYIMIHATHGSLPMQFLSPRWNRRTDKYGEDRTLFLRRLIEECRKAVGPDIALSVNVSAHEAPQPGENPPGYDENYLYDYILPFLNSHPDVNWIDITAGTIAHMWGQAWLLLPMYFEQGSFLKYAREAKRRFPDAVIGTAGKIMDPRMAERIVEDGTTDLVGLGRIPWADPDYPKKALAGKYDEVRQCTSCGYCVSFFYLGLICTCAVNPVFHREHLGWETLTPALQPKRVLVVGGGVGGMEAARVAATRGHKVVIYEKTDKLGGIVNIASDIPYVDTMDLAHLPAWQKNQLAKLKVEISYGKEVTPEVVEQLQPDVVIVATGSRSTVPELPGVDRPNVMTIDTYLEEKPEIQGKAVVLGGYEGAETALSLGRQGVETTLVCETDQMMSARYVYGMYDRQFTLAKGLSEAGVQMIMNAQINGITAEGVEITVGDQRQVLPADTVVMGIGRESVDGLGAALTGKVPEVYVIGDAFKPRTTAEAVEDGYRIGRRI